MYRAPFAATSKMAYFGPAVQKLRLRPRHYCNRYFFNGFSESCAILKNPIFQKSKRTTQKHKNGDGQQRNMSWPFFRQPNSWYDVSILGSETLKFQFSLQFWAFYTPTKNASFTPTRTQKRRQISKTKNPFSRGSLS